MVVVVVVVVVLNAVDVSTVWPIVIGKVISPGKKI
jgi:hypothetical protein